MSETVTGLPLKMVGEDGNAFFILGRASKVLKQNGMRDRVKEFQDEATADDYNHLLRTCMKWFEVDPPDDDEVYDDDDDDDDDDD